MKSIWILLLFSSIGLKAQDSLIEDNIFPAMEYALEYLSPIHDNRQIETVTTHIHFGWERINTAVFTFSFGFTGSYAWGEITQSDGFNNRNVFMNKAFGLGPSFLLRYEVLKYKNLSLSAMGTGGFIFYSKRFPYGGDIYNFMWRAGPGLHYRINSKTKINFSWIWMHVSNGQGINNKNPSYEVRGICFSLSKLLKQ